MELYQLRSFVVMADEMHVGRAAKRLHLAQPTLSRQLAALERDLGLPLFSRVRRRLRLTTTGEVFLGRVREILRQTDEAAQEARRADRGELGTLRLGYVQSAIYEAVPRLVERFRTACPDVRVEVQAMTTLRQIDGLRSNELDAGLLRPQQPSDDLLGGLTTRVLTRGTWQAVLPAAHPLAGSPHVALAALAAEPFVLYAREEGSTGRDTILAHCARAGFAPRVVQEATDAQTIVALVAAKLGVSLLLGPTPPVDPGLVVCRPLDGYLPSWELTLAWSDANPSSVLARFLAVTAE